MLKKSLIVSAMIIFSVNMIFAQGSTNSNSTITKSELNSNFIETLSGQSDYVLEQAIEGGSPEVKGIVLEVLSKKGAENQNALNIINRYIYYGISDYSTQNSDAYIRYKAIQAAGVLKSKTSVIPLSQLLYSEESTPNLLMAIYALGEIGDKKATQSILIRLRLASNQSVVYEAVLALGKIGDTAALADLLEVSQDSKYNNSVREAAINSLKQLKETPATNDENATAEQ